MAGFLVDHFDDFDGSMTNVRLLRPIPSYTTLHLSSKLPQILHSHKPFIISQSFEDMPAISRWLSPNYFHQFYNHRIEIEVSPYDAPGYGERHESDLGEFMTLLTQSLPFRVYMAQSPLLDQIPQLKKDVKSELVERILREGEVYSTATWIGRKSLTPLHHDPRALTNLFVEISGQKEFRLFDPDVKREALELGEGTMKNTSSVDVWTTDIGEGWEGTVNAGDGLVIPRGWWHSVRSKGDDINMSVNWWFKLKDQA